MCFGGVGILIGSALDSCLQEHPNIPGASLGLKEISHKNKDGEIKKSTVAFLAPSLIGFLVDIMIAIGIMIVGAYICPNLLSLGASVGIITAGGLYGALSPVGALLGFGILITCGIVKSSLTKKEI